MAVNALRKKNPDLVDFYLKNRDRKKYRNRTSYTEGRQKENIEGQKRN